ncbi:MAG: hypothetical protein ACJAW8_002453 [Oleispira sp.]
MAILLLSTQACHLCELAQGVLQQAFSQPEIVALSQHDLHIYLQDIIDQPLWLEQYGEKIPVLLDESSALTLEWPFDALEAVRWLQKVAANTGPLSA